MAEGYRWNDGLDEYDEMDGGGFLDRAHKAYQGTVDGLGAVSQGVAGAYKSTLDGATAMGKGTFQGIKTGFSKAANLAERAKNALKPTTEAGLIEEYIRAWSKVNIHGEIQPSGTLPSGQVGTDLKNLASMAWILNKIASSNSTPEPNLPPNGAPIWIQRIVNTSPLLEDEDHDLLVCGSDAVWCVTLLDKWVNGENQWENHMINSKKAPSMFEDKPKYKIPFTELRDHLEGIVTGEQKAAQPGTQNEMPRHDQLRDDPAGTQKGPQQGPQQGEEVILDQTIVQQQGGGFSYKYLLAQIAKFQSIQDKTLKLDSKVATFDPIRVFYILHKWCLLVLGPDSAAFDDAMTFFHDAFAEMKTSACRIVVKGDEPSVNADTKGAVAFSDGKAAMIPFFSREAPPSTIQFYIGVESAALQWISDATKDLQNGAQAAPQQTMTNQPQQQQGAQQQQQGAQQHTGTNAAV